MLLNDDVQLQKSALRAEYKRIRAGMSAEEKQRLDDGVFHRIVNLRQYIECETLFIYVSSPIEVDTRQIIENAFERSKRVAVPRCIPGECEMEFYYITSFADLESGSYGIFEPIKSRCKLVEDYESGLCVVPALAFDENGYRLGFGKGYYDRFLSHFGGNSVGLCYESCICTELPKNCFDRHTDIVISEKRVISNG